MAPILILEVGDEDCVGSRPTCVLRKAIDWTQNSHLVWKSQTKHFFLPGSGCLGPMTSRLLTHERQMQSQVKLRFGFSLGLLSIFGFPAWLHIDLAYLLWT